MRIAEVIGTVTLSRVHPTLIGARWVIGVPFSLKALKEGAPDGEDLVRPHPSFQDQRRDVLEQRWRCRQVLPLLRMRDDPHHAGPFRE